ncbi:uncharacterized protein PFLUO_LOCUS220 [Penicillium psychrofluorescens]|uniref:uncharacterized protein n=1 Tax=Penicillium psychrofluorescens TaxID=3158075 RepID=UPI003CCD52B2
MHLPNTLVALVFSLSLSLPVATLATSDYDSECFSDPGTLQDQGSYDFQSLGYCRAQCWKGHFTVAALSKMSCWCGHDMPPKDKQVKDSKCNVPCAGYPEDECGGHNAWSVFSIGDPDGGISNDGPISASTAAGGIVVAPTGATGTVPSKILTAPTPAKTTTPAASGSATASSSRTSSSSMASATPPPANAADTVRAGSSVLGAAFAALAWLL